MNINIEGRGNTKQFIGMLAWIELLGSIGHTADFKAFVNGDGSTQWKFKFEDEDQQKAFDEFKKFYLNQYNKNHKNIDYFVI